MDRLLPDRLKALWRLVDLKQLTPEQFNQEQERLLAEYRDLWEQALIRKGYKNLQESLCAELALFSGCEDLSEIQRRCSYALANVKHEWCGKVDRADHQTVAKFYNESEAMIYELMWWHTLREDASPLAYVTALHFARLHGCTSYLDFGAGVGSGAILFARHGLEVTLADISSTMLDFSQWRFHLRDLSGHFVDLKTGSLPHTTYDMIAAMDVFEHLVDPAQTVEDLWHSLKPGGFLFGRFHSEQDEERPHHIVQDFGPTLERLRALGFEEAWRDEWLWGHQVFQKRS
jgi:2-polyprenyl-3-methyl-5-hydroxy-6-metoxy-1,4-benzoquinol methylase